MKKHITFVLCSFYLFILSNSLLMGQEYQDWKWLHEQPQGNRLRWVKIWDTNNWYAIGEYGTYMKTTNGGTSWYFHHQAGIPSSTLGGTGNINDVHFFDMNNGVLVGTAGIRRTTDGGLTFSNATTFPTATYNHVYFLNASLGYATGTSAGRLVKTTDGGLTWTLNTMITSATHYDVYTPNDTLLLVSAANGVIRRSTDGGASFTNINTGQSFTVNRLKFKDANYGWCAGTAGKALFTTDGGATWNNASTGLPATTTFNDIDFVGSNQVVLTGDANYLYSTTNNGSTWTTIDFLAPVSQQPYTSTYFSTDFSGNDFVTVGSFGLINSNFSSNKVCHTYLKRTGTIFDTWADGNGKIITVGAPSADGVYDQIFYSTNGGITWSAANTTLTDFSTNRTIKLVYQDDEASFSENHPLTSTPTATFRSIEMINDLIGFTVGSNSAVYKTTNGGLTWDSLVTTIDNNQILYKVDFVNANVGWIFSNTVNNAGTIWKTTNGGVTWTQQALTGQSGNNTRISGAHMLNENLGWVISAKPAAYKTTNGGTTWIEQTLPDGFTGTLSDIFMVNQNIGYIVGGIGTGNLGRYYKTTDGGANWNQDPLLNVLPPAPAVVVLTSVQFLSANYGVITGTSGLNLYTTDAGANWTLYMTGNGGSTLNSIFAVPTSTTSVPVYAAGTNGSIHKHPGLYLPGPKLNLTLMIEGLFNGTSMVSDTVTVELHNSTSPYDLIESGKIVVDNSGQGSGIFNSAVEGTNYYIAVKHRNGLETWSATPQEFSGGVLGYNFTTAATQAYGSNQVLVGTKFCIYIGDVSDGLTAGLQDGYIDIFDDFEVYNDSYSATYRLLTDLNLDGFVDIFDDLYVYNNSYNGVTASYPGFPRPGFLKKDFSKIKTKKELE